MPYRSLRHCTDDLAKHGRLVRIDAEVDANLEVAAIHRRVFAAGGPALLFSRVRGCRFPMASNLFGTLERSRFMFRDAYERVSRLIELKIDPTQALKSPLRYASAPLAALSMLPRYVGDGPITAGTCRVSELPQQVSWPRDGGAFVTLPQVYTEDPRAAGLGKSNLGMYRIQLSGGDYAQDEEIGLHYQLHRSIGVHQAAAMRAGKPFPVNVFVGGPPAMMLAAVMPLPEGMSELGFAGALGGRRVRMVRRAGGLPMHADADFAICGTVVDGLMKPEGPFGDHLGYYSLRHPFPVLRVERVYCRKDAIWPFTVVGRPPQEDTAFGQLIHDLTGPIIPSVLPGIHGVHAVDAAGVHPLLLAIGSERYMPFMAEARPQELLTQASAILGQGQLSLAKFLLIAAHNDDPQLDIHDLRAFFAHVLSRADWTRDLHFQTQTTIDTLDYSGDALNAGSKLVIAAAGPPRFELASDVPHDLRLPDGFSDPHLVMPGVLAIRGPGLPKPSFDYDAVHRGALSGQAMQAAALGQATSEASRTMERFCARVPLEHPLNRFRLLLIVDDPAMTAASLENFAWVAFTRANPAADVYGVGAFTHQKHWGCRGVLVLDARIKPHHAPVLEEDPAVTRRIEALAVAGGPLAGLW
ncbi:4-hydroxybenzoate decarboxylase subunit C [Pirellulimonas nuda]|uniref:4-hydroxybenzoate decarboxylase subunit C n=1 Tax=Pirellulimonas nuda TaxID=2528009 RepID=A0A518DHZ5_9BACT|nr:UbiD family decarboxylase [Pirellulimonas nuda]QDU91095.1 4-hydroxybenzoate decarboxylase subunit C [Pirellulimonas nuda]